MLWSAIISHLNGFVFTSKDMHSTSRNIAQTNVYVSQLQCMERCPFIVSYVESELIFFFFLIFCDAVILPGSPGFLKSLFTVAYFLSSLLSFFFLC